MKFVRLTEVAPVTTDRVRPFEGERPYIATGGLDDSGNLAPEMVTYTDRPSRADVTIRPGDVCMARMQATSKVLRFGPAHTNLILSTGFAVFRPIPELLHPGFLYHYLRTTHFQKAKDALCSGATQKAITNENIGDLKIPLFPLVEQRRIAAVLDHAEALRGTRLAALAQLDQLTHAIFLAMFGDPVSNPKGWPSGTLGAALEFQQYGPRFHNEAYSDDGIRIVRITDLSESGRLNFSAMPRMAVTDAEREKFQLEPGDLIFARTGATVGKVALIERGDPDCIAGAYFIRLRFAPSIEPIYARAVLTSPSVRQIVARRSRQAAQQNFSGPLLRELPMPVPPVSTQRDFVIRTAAVMRLTAANRASLLELNALFAGLQDRAFRGEL